MGFEETPDYDFLRDLFTKVLKNHGDTDDEVYDWMLMNNGRGLLSSSEKRSSRNHHHQSQQQQLRQSQQQLSSTQPIAAATTRNNAVLDNPYGRTQQMNTNHVQHHQHEYDEENEDSRKQKGFWRQFISFVTCGFVSCF